MSPALIAFCLLVAVALVALLGLCVLFSPEREPDEHESHPGTGS